MNARLAIATCAVLALGVASAQAGQCTNEINGLSKTLASKDAGTGPSSGATGSIGTPGAQTGQHPPTSAMNQATGGSAASPQDVQRQTQGQPTAAAEAGGAKSATGGDLAGASAALARARTLDGQGKEAECMAAIGEAKKLSGS
jgi:hypothetical protein